MHPQEQWILLIVRREWVEPISQGWTLLHYGMSLLIYFWNEAEETLKQ